MERLPPLIISMTIAAIASSPDVENLARSSRRASNRWTCSPAIKRSSSCRDRETERGEERREGEVKRADGWIPWLQGNRYPRVYRESELETRPPFNCLFFPPFFFPSFSGPKLNPLPCPFSGSLLTRRGFFQLFFFFISGPRLCEADSLSWNERYTFPR